MFKSCQCCQACSTHSTQPRPTHADALVVAIWSDRRGRAGAMPSAATRSARCCTSTLRLDVTLYGAAHARPPADDSQKVQFVRSIWSSDRATRGRRTPTRYHCRPTIRPVNTVKMLQMEIDRPAYVHGDRGNAISMPSMLLNHLHLASSHNTHALCRTRKSGHITGDGWRGVRSTGAGQRRTTSAFCFRRSVSLSASAENADAAGSRCAPRDLIIVYLFACTATDGGSTVDADHRDQALQPRGGAGQLGAGRRKTVGL